MNSTSATRSARASHAMVASPHDLATTAGVAALREGGSAADAIVAAAAVLAVVYPHMCSIGGDAFALLFDPRERRLLGLNGSGRSPARASIDLLRGRGFSEMPVRGTLPITVPGVVDTWRELSLRFGRLPFARSLAPAIQHARDGFLVTDSVARAIAANAAELRDLSFARVFAPRGLPPAGTRMTLPALARTLERVAAAPDSFYRGDLASELARALHEAGALLEREDLEAHHAEWVEPLTSQYRGLTVAELPPNTAGIVPLLILKLVERLDLDRLGLDDPRRIDGLVRATRLAFTTARPLITDPALDGAPIEHLLAEDRVERLAHDLRSEVPVHDQARVRGDTVYLCAVDSDGMACSFIQSVYFPFGSGFVAEDTGVLFQNRGAYFSLDPAHVNALAPRKRTYHTLMPAMALRRGRPWLVFGTMGADGQPQTQVQVLTAIVAHGLDVQDALDAPRWLAGRSFVGGSDETLALESRFPAAIDEPLRARGHLVRRVEPWSELMGHAHAIRIGDGGLEGGADRRSDGLASGY